MPPGSTLRITGQIQSKPYLDLTTEAITCFGGGHGKEGFHSPGYITVEGDWSNGAFFITASMLGSKLDIQGLDVHSVQGDRAILDLLPQIAAAKPCISAAQIPDLIPILSVAAAIHHGAVFTDIQRLRLKESDRVTSTITMIESLGGKAEATENTLTIYSTGLTGGIVDSFHDHRIAMAAAMAATKCTKTVTILGAECVSKSYPQFWEEYTRLGGKYEQYIR
jgi:3-phosphoshikimate 1-carboxyvinyltransferase